MFEHGTHDSTETKGRFNNTGGILFLHDIDNFLLKLDMFLGECSFVLANRYFNFTLFFKNSFEFSFLFFIQFL